VFPAMAVYMAIFPGDTNKFQIPPNIGPRLFYSAQNALKCQAR
jgi:hypothetical protein